MARTSRRGPWLPEEDSALIDLVRTQGPNNWVRISQQLQHRSPKQCRERYHQNLKPSLNHDPISAQEGERIEQLVEEMGKRWAEIARRLGNRSDNAVKNWWNGSINRRKRSPSTQVNLRHSSDRLHPIPSTGSQLPPFEISDRPGSNATMGITVHHHHFHDPWASTRATSPGLPRPGSLEFEQYPERRTSSSGVPSHFSSVVHGQHSYSDRPSYDRQPEQDSMRSRLPSLRLPPLLSSRVNSIYVPGLDRPSISPAQSEFSHTYSTRPVPSLVSDNQSTCSVSPKTLTSPHASTTPYAESVNYRWSHSDRLQSFSYQGIKGQLPLSPLQVESLVIPPIVSVLDRTLPNYKDTHQPGSREAGTFEHATLRRSEPLRDSRMHVSSLVQ